MNTQKWFLVLIAVSLVALIGSAAGCGVTAPAASVAQPTISSFSASPPSITQGQQTTLSWIVSGATTVNIEPDIGTIGLTGSLTLTPNASVTYTLTASNESGSSTSSATVNVTPVVAGKPDLVITDVYLVSNQFYYKIKNQGNAVAPQTQTDFYLSSIDQTDQRITWSLETSNFVDMLAPGEERIQRFSNLDWNRYQLVEPYLGFLTYNFKACANADNAIAESNTSNNCLIVTLGQDFIYDFVKQAHLAKWTNSTYTLFWPMTYFDVKGAAYLITYNPVLVMCPEKVNNGWIMGKFGDFYVDPTSKAASVRDLNIPIQAQFTSKVGFAPGITSPGGVTVALGYYDAMGSLIFFDKMTVISDGQMHDYNVDLSSLAGKHTQFVLWAQANGSPQNTCVRWQEPKITQKMIEQ
ncbi:MAG: hypothetical protein MUO89_08600 [Dehalococcoidia bacterium]|nr:hypothetical protein [Dehalococcoidia bacterium]